MIAARTPPPDTLLTSREAAARLGVKLETLYAYVARGLLRSERAGRMQARRYSARAVEALLVGRRGRRDPQAAAAGALFWGMPVVESAVSCTDGERLLYRGRDAVGLAARGRFEQVAALLWEGSEPRTVGDWPTVDTREIEAAARAPGPSASASPIATAQLLAAALALGDDDRFDTSPGGVTATARRMIPRLVAAMAMANRGSMAGAASGPMGARVLAALGGRIGEERARMADRALILSAEHELNASTFAARVAASTGADPYAVLCAALATLGGPKHGGATQRVEALVRETGTPARAAQTLAGRLARGEVVPGFGHPLYPDGDPRVEPLLAAARASRAPNRRAGEDLKTLFAIVDAMAARDRPPPTLDVALVATARVLGLAPGGAALLFAFGRTAGWMAHALEQYAMDELIRPRARYVGPRGEDP